MDPTRNDTAFAGSIPELYDTQLVPLIFEPYAIDLVDRLLARSPARVLEIAAGTGVVTRRMSATLPATTSIVATDLNPPMLVRAQAVGTARPVQWQAADAMSLPFADASFDAVVCQFGVMFFPDKAHAYAEARRVLAPGGLFLFNAWDRIEHNEFADTADRVVAALLGGMPATFMARVPHGYHDLATIAGDLRRGGFTAPPATATVTARSRAASARVPAAAYCLGTPMRNEIEARDPALLDTAVARTAEALAARFGTGPVDGKIQAHVIAVER
jgi:SAM-dependent methyltransferase